MREDDCPQPAPSLWVKVTEDVEKTVTEPVVKDIKKKVDQTPVKKGTKNDIKPRWSGRKRDQKKATKASKVVDDDEE